MRRTFLYQLMTALRWWVRRRHRARRAGKRHWSPFLLAARKRRTW